MKFHAQGFLYHGRCWKEHRKLFSFLMHLETSLNLSIFTVRHQESMQNVNTYMNEMWIKWIPVVSGNTTIRFTSAVLPNPTAQASWDRRRKQKRKKYQLFTLPCNSLFGLIPDFQSLAGKATCSIVGMCGLRVGNAHGVPAQGTGPRPLLALPEACHAPSPALCPAIQLPQVSQGPKDTLGLGVTALFSLWDMINMLPLTFTITFYSLQLFLFSSILWPWHCVPRFPVSLFFSLFI